MDLLFLIISLVLFAIGIAINSLMSPRTTSISRYNDNGKRIKIKVTTLPEISQTDDCLPESLKICDTKDAFSCGKCKQPLATCHHIPTDMTIEVAGSKEIFIKANKNKNEGYCLALNSSGSARTCTRKNGGKWILVLNPKQTLYRFECFCSQHNYFVNSPIDNDCTQFTGCLNGEIKDNDWKSLDEIDCDCIKDHESTRTAHNSSVSEAPQCVLKNIFKWKEPPFPVLEAKFIDPLYIKLMGDDVKLPNPCLYDLTTGMFNNDIGKISIDQKTNIAFCEPLKVGYSTAVTNSDYLLNNNGNYANCIYSFTKNIQDLAARSDEQIYEYHRTKVDTPDNVLQGVRVNYNDFKFKLNYLEPDSSNMGGGGVFYNYAPRIPKERQRHVYVYVYNAPTPKPMDTHEIILGKMLSWVPCFMPQPGIESTNRVYNGIMPLRGGSSDRLQKVLYPDLQAKQSCLKLADQTGLYPVKGPNGYDDKFAIDYALPLVVGNDFKSRLNTGVILNYHVKDMLYSKPLSCGSLNQTQKYRLNFNPNFSVLFGVVAYYRWMFYRFRCEDEYLADDRDTHMWPETCYGLEVGGIGCVEPYVGKYTVSVDENKVNWCKKY